MKEESEGNFASGGPEDKPREPMSRRAKVAWIVALAAGTILALSILIGEGGSTGPTAGDSPSAEETYLRFMRERIDGAVGKTDAELIDGGHRLCDELGGKTVDDLGTLAVVLGYDMQEFADAIVGSVNAFCPEYDHLLGE